MTDYTDAVGPMQRHTGCIGRGNGHQMNLRLCQAIGQVEHVIFVICNLAHAVKVLLVLQDANSSERHTVWA